MADVREAIAAERRELVAVLAELPAERWDEHTLCAGWRVREVVAHMTLPFRHSKRRVVFELVKARGDFNRVADRCARADAGRLSAAELAACLRDNAEHPWKPPRGGYDGALTHDVVHGLDFTIPLGVGRRVPNERLWPVLDGMASARGVKFFGVDLDGVRLQADDLDWSFGSGVPVTGAAQDLLMVLAGRRLPYGRLSGEHAARFTRDAVRSGSEGRP